MSRIQSRLERSGTENSEGEAPPSLWVKRIQTFGRDYAKSAENWQAKRQKAMRDAQKLVRGLIESPKTSGEEPSEPDAAKSVWVERLQEVGRNYAQSAEDWQATRRKAFRDYNDAAERWQARRRQAVRDVRELLSELNLHAAVLEIEHRLRRYLASASWKADRELFEPPPGPVLRQAIWKLAKSTNGETISISTLKRCLGPNP